MTVKVNEENQKILKDALRCYRDKRVSTGEDVRDIKSLLDEIMEEIRFVEREEGRVNRKVASQLKSAVAKTKKEYIKKVSGEEP